MFKTLLKTIFRNAQRRPVFTTINLLGLSLGIACSFIMLRYVQQEWSYDKHFAEGDRVFRIGTGFMNMGSFAVSQEILRENVLVFNDIEAATRLTTRGGEQTLKIGEETFIQDQTLFVDSTFFEVFAYRFEDGNPAKALQSPNSVVITADLAEKFFGKRHVVGEYIEVGEEQNLFQVTGVVEEQTKNSHLPTGMWMPIYPRLRDEDNWMSGSLYNYVKLSSGADRSDLIATLDELVRKEVYPKVNPGMELEAWVASSNAVKFYPQQLKEIYLGERLRFDLSSGGNPLLVNILAIIGLIILVMASFNYINLSTAVGITRAKEIGVKKTLGAATRLLQGRFLLEAMVFSLTAALVAAVMADTLLLLVEKATGSRLLETLFESPIHVLGLAAFAMFVGLLSGLYPAFFLTRFRPAQVLKGQLGVQKRSFFRGGLIVIQFTLAAFLLIGTLTVYQQFQFMRVSDKGFKHENVLVLYNLDSLGTSKESFRQQLVQHTEVVSSSFNSRMPAGRNLWQATYKTPEMEHPLSLNTFPIDEHYLRTLDMPILDGRNFDAQLASDSSGLIVNEAAVKALGLQEPVGQRINEEERIIGVVKDFNFQDYHHAVEPIVMIFDDNRHNLSLKLKGEDMTGFLAHLEEKWQAFVPEEPVSYYFLDENLAALSEKEGILSKAIALFSLLALFIACLGLFGLAVFMTALRTKEMGIRKVLGASVEGIVGLLAKDFLRLIGIATVVAIPFAYWGTNQWLADFVFRIQLDWWLFVLPSIAILVIAWLTVSYHSLRLARKNPVESLHVE